MTLSTKVIDCAQSGSLSTTSSWAFGSTAHAGVLAALPQPARSPAAMAEISTAANTLDFAPIVLLLISPPSKPMHIRTLIGLSSMFRRFTDPLFCTFILATKTGQKRHKGCMFCTSPWHDATPNLPEINCLQYGSSGCPLPWHPPMPLQKQPSVFRPKKASPDAFFLHFAVLGIGRKNFYFSRCSRSNIWGFSPQISIGINKKTNAGCTCIKTRHRRMPKTMSMDERAYSHQNQASRHINNAPNG